MKQLHTVSLLGFDPFCFFQKLRKTERSPSFFTSGRWTIITWDPKQTIVGDDVSALEDLKKSVSSLRAHSVPGLPFLGGAIGFVSYDAARVSLGVQSRHRKDGRIPDVLAHVYQHALLFDGESVTVVGGKDFLESVRAIHARTLDALPAPALHWTPSMSHAEYVRAYREVKHGILHGDYYQLNLSYQLRSRTDESPQSLFVRLARQMKSPMCSYIEQGETAILSMSPERFVTMSHGKIQSEPIKGTRPRGRTEAIDKRFAKDLFNDPKETAELSMIVDLLRNDIGKVSIAGSVSVLKHRCLQKNTSVWHTYSVIEGTVDPSLHPLDAYRSMLPGGSVTGCPKIASMEAIDRLENTARGAYCGSAFLLSENGFFDSSILIRTVVQDRKKLSLGVGGGIVHDSRSKDEYDETQKKAERFLSLPSRQTWINGVSVQTDRRLRFLDPSQQNVKGIFETLRGENGRIQDLSQHLHRLHRSAEALHMTLPFSRAQIESMIRSCVRSSSAEHILRWKIVCTKSDVIIASEPLILDPSDAYGVSATHVCLDRHLPMIKALPYHREWKAHTEAAKKGFSEAILIDNDGIVTEGAYSNIFWVIDGVLSTKRDGVLPGVTRAMVIRRAKKLRIPFSFGEITPKQLLRADEVFMTSSLRKVTPIVRIDDKKIGSGEVGRVTRSVSKVLTPGLRFA